MNSPTKLNAFQRDALELLQCEVEPLQRMTTLMSFVSVVDDAELSQLAYDLSGALAKFEDRADELLEGSYEAQS